MRLPVARFRCRNGHEFEDALPPGSYGQFVLRSSTGKLVAVDAFDDPVFAEVDQMVNELDVVSALDDARRGEVVRAAFEETVDADSAQGRFSFTQDPSCPLCGSTVMDWFEVVDPPRFIERDVPPATHESWFALNDDEKQSVVRQAAIDSLSA